MKTTNRINSPKNCQQLTSELMATARKISAAMQHLELEEEEITYSLQVARFCIC